MNLRKSATMSDAAPHDDHAAHHDAPPTLPQVKDEAGDSPTWLPFTGLALLALIALVAVFRMQSTDDVAPVVDAPAAELADEEAPAEH